MRERMEPHRPSRAGRGNLSRGADLRKEHRAARVDTTHHYPGSPRNA
jgi:hypothetical protein